MRVLFRDRLVRRDNDRLRVALAILWAILGALIAYVAFAVLVVLQMPFDGGMAHMLFAYNPGGNLDAGRAVAGMFVLVTAVIVCGLRRWRYPLPWYAVAMVVSVIALTIWSPLLTTSAASGEFRRQGWLLATLFPTTAFATSAFVNAPRHVTLQAWFAGSLCALVCSLGFSLGAVIATLLFLGWGVHVMIDRRIRRTTLQR